MTNALVDLLECEKALAVAWVELDPKLWESEVLLEELLGNEPDDEVTKADAGSPTAIMPGSAGSVSRLVISSLVIPSGCSHNINTYRCGVEMGGGPGAR